jgi:outer membrane protein TolC
MENRGRTVNTVPFPAPRRTTEEVATAMFLLLLVFLWGLPVPLGAQASPLEMEECITLALEANPGFQSIRAALDATRADLTVARSSRFPSLGLSASAARYETAGSGALDRHSVGLALQQTLYQGGRIRAQVDAGEAALEAGEEALASARADLVLAVRQAWFSVAQGERLVVSAREGLERSRLNLEYAEARLEAGLGTRPDVLRARVDVSAAELELTRAENVMESSRAVLNILMGQSPATPLQIREEASAVSFPPLPSWDDLRDAALGAREEVRAAQARTARQEAEVRFSRGSFFPSISAEGAVSRGASASRSPSESWSLEMGLSLPLFQGFARRGDLRARQALLESARFQESAVSQAVEGEVWEALLAEKESTRRLENARALYQAAEENLEAAQESYRQGLGSMIALVDARTAFTGAEQTLIQAEYDRRVARAVLERMVWGDTFGGDQP